MINGKRVAVIMPAYNAAKALEQTVREIPETVGVRILVDDGSTDETLEIARRLGCRFLCTEQTMGEASSINFSRSVAYGFGVLTATLKCWLQRWKMRQFRLYSPNGRKLLLNYYERQPGRQQEVKLPSHKRFNASIVAKTGP